MTSYNEEDDHTGEASAPSISTVSQQPPDNTVVDSTVREPEQEDDTASAQSQQASAGEESSPPPPQSSKRPDVPRSYNEFPVSQPEEYGTVCWDGEDGEVIEEKRPVRSMQENYNAAIFWSPGGEDEITRQYSAYEGWNPAWAKK